MFYFNPDTIMTNGSKMSFDQKISVLQEQLTNADAVVIGAGSGLSTAAGYTYSGERFEKYFADFERKYGFRDMYSGGFYPYQTMEEFWGYWCRNIWINRYAPIPSDLYGRLLALIKDKDYFVLTTNVDHCFQRSGFDKKRLFYTQGDYGLFQSSSPDKEAKKRTYDNYEVIRKMILSEGYQIEKNGKLIVPKDTKVRMTVPSDLVPVCPDDGKLMTTNLRCDDSFVEDEGWHQAAERYQEFLRRHERLRVLYLELGVGMNTPVIIKFPFWEYTKKNPNAFYACVNLGEAGCSREIVKRSVCIDKGIGEVLNMLGV
ncbi:MAG: Sir2 silent information regulator family NAD-dependent deacetylase [Lachnospiraceae bacterium]|jgi:NAD-dependent SIR2 family protein deacetylase|nr:Sir2 silent information regulator family NAD-dependent deacetylase [Lachnospiraceae bacterium]MCH4063578.1 Sir2 silent information regulator family NAD-dependent deacetylase [Lachnospiraceae bacterium]MCI1551724.1 Sir2 silent information regulator family NAD-dependent deacetylase [Lachnospiraceae bacterium]